jgi:hypothetical protein
MRPTRLASPFRAHGRDSPGPEPADTPGNPHVYRTDARFGFSGQRVPAAKLAALAEFDLDFPAVVNIGCQRQLIAAMRRPRLQALLMHRAGLIAIRRAPPVEP